MTRSRLRSAAHRLLLPVAALLTIGAAPALPHRPMRIVSLNMCADQYLLALADPGQIAALTRFSRDPALSAAADAAQRVPVSRGTAEDVVALDPDLVIASPGRRSGTMAALANRRYPTLEVKSAESYADIVAQVRKVADAVGHPERGEALIARMDAALAALPRARSGGVAAYYQRRGYLSGSGTLIDDLMHRAGLANLAVTLRRPALSQLSLEQLVAAHPDYLIVDADAAGMADLGNEMLRHPVLRDIPRVALPQAWTVCGGPAYVKAATSLSEQLRTHR